jgi:hypothetical protein
MEYIFSHLVVVNVVHYIASSSYLSYRLSRIFFIGIQIQCLQNNALENLHMPLTCVSYFRVKYYEEADSLLLSVQK